MRDSGRRWRAAPFLLALAAALITPALLAVNPMPPYGTYPCASSTTNCQGGST